MKYRMLKVTPEGIGNVIRFLRKEKELNQSELSKLASVPTSTLSAFETGVHIPNFKVFFKLLETLDAELVIATKEKK